MPIGVKLIDKRIVIDRRIVFTYGWDRTAVIRPPRSTTVEIVLRPHRSGTELHLVHRGLEGPMADAHAAGWANYLTRLAIRAAGRALRTRSPAAEQVPTAGSSACPAPAPCLAT